MKKIFLILSLFLVSNLFAADAGESDENPFKDSVTRAIYTVCYMYHGHPMVERGNRRLVLGNDSIAFALYYKDYRDDMILNALDAKLKSSYGKTYDSFVEKAFQQGEHQVFSGRDEYEGMFACGRELCRKMLDEKYKEADSFLSLDSYKK